MKIANVNKRNDSKTRSINDVSATGPIVGATALSVNIMSNVRYWMAKAITTVAVSRRPMGGIIRLTGIMSGEVIRRMPCAIGLRKSALSHGNQKRNNITSRNSCARVLMIKISAGFIDRKSLPVRRPFVLQPQLRL